MDLFKRDTHIDFMAQRRLAMIFSAVLLVISVGSIAVQGLHLGLDFTGGTLIEVSYPKPVDLDGVRDRLAEQGLEDAVVQHFGTSREILIRLAPQHGDTRQVSDRVLKILRADNSDVALQRVEFVGPQVGEELTNKGGIAMLCALAGILIYVAFRFEYRFSVGAVLGLIHDVIITLGLFSVFQLDFDLTVLAAVLAVIGYSINDTIVVFDRIRENFIRVRKKTAAEIANLSINQMLSRTLMTSGTTLIAVGTLYVLGPDLIAGFSLALIFGIVIGTFSSIYIASAVALALGISREDMMPPQKEGAEADERP